MRDKFGIEPGSEVDFVAGTEDIGLHKVVDRTKRLDVPGCRVPRIHLAVRARSFAGKIRA